MRLGSLVMVGVPAPEGEAWVKIRENYTQPKILLYIAKNQCFEKSLNLKTTFL